MLGVWVTAAVFLLLIVLLFLPVKVIVRFDKEVSVKVKLAFLPVYQIDSSKHSKSGQPPEKPETKTEEKKENIFGQVFQKEGFKDGIKLLFDFAGKLLKKMKKLLRHIVFDQLIFNLSVASEDAAQTAILYGEVCSAAYPFFSLLDHFSNVKYKEINISSDFTSKKTDFSFSAMIRTRLWFLLLFAVVVFFEFLSFRKQVQNDE